MGKSFWFNKRILITGGSGFLGSWLVSYLKREDPKSITVPRSASCDLRDVKNIREVIKGQDVVVHLAANVGGIGYNQKHPAELFYDNAIMGIQLIHESWRAGVEKIVLIGTVCSYPANTPVPFKEKDIWSGYPEPTNAAYGLAKKMLLVQAQAYRRQYGLNAVYLIPVNIYGPGDHFEEEKSHVIPAIIRKVYEAKISQKKELTVWGTGRPTREFFYVKDTARGILLATERYNKPDPINLGGSEEVTIKSLIETIARLMDFRGKIVWDASKPDGQMRRKLDTMKAKREFGFVAQTSLRQGLIETIRWFHEHKSRILK